MDEAPRVVFISVPECIQSVKESLNCTGGSSMIQISKDSPNFEDLASLQNYFNGRIKPFPHLRTPPSPTALTCLSPYIFPLQLLMLFIQYENKGNDEIKIFQSFLFVYSVRGFLNWGWKCPAGGLIMLPTYHQLYSCKRQSRQVVSYIFFFHVRPVEGIGLRNGITLFTYNGNGIGLACSCH